MNYLRKTLRQTALFEGVGLHGGHPVKVRVHPGTDGLAFRVGATRWQATVENVTDTSRCTRLGEVSTIEHLMSALAALEVTDGEIEVEGGEMPGLDGSAKEFVSGLVAAGFEDLSEATIEPPFKRVFFQEKDVKVAIGKGSGHWQYTYDLGDRWPGSQTFESVNVLANYATEIAPARTLALEEELPMIRQYGLGKGLDEHSALVIGKNGYVNDARFSDEPARHKLLDLIGDLYLANVPIRFLNVSAERSGHTSNVKSAALLREFLQT